jgi:D-3-phosphoglycerate dehydrogenase
VFTGLAGGVARAITVEVRGEIIEHRRQLLQLAALTGR